MYCNTLSINDQRVDCVAKKGDKDIYIYWGEHGKSDQMVTS